MKKKIRVLAACLLLVLLATACGSSSDSMTNGFSGNKGFDSVSNDVAYDMGVTEEKWEVETEGAAAPGAMDGTAESSSEIFTGEKLVYTCDLTIQTLDYDNCVKSITDHIRNFNGIIESETENDDAYRWYYQDYVKKNGTRYLYLTVRIPSENYYQFLDNLEGTGKIISKSSYVENISRKYYETDAMIQSLEIQQDRLLEMMEQATSIEDMITIEDRLSEVQYQLSIYKNQLASMDADVEYSTVSIRVEEVMEYIQEEPIVKTNTFWDRLKNTLWETWEFFLEMLEGMLFLLIRFLPIALVLGIIALIIRAILIKDKKKRLKKIEEAQKAALQNGQIPPQQ